MKRKILTILLIISVIIFSGRAWSDFGSFSGNSDYGSSSHSSSSSSSSSRGSSSSRSSSSPSRSYSIPRSTTRTNNSNINVVPLAGAVSGISSGSSTGSDLDELSGVVFVLLVFFAFWWFSHRKAKKRQHERAIINIEEPVRNLKPMNEYLELDPEFDEERIKTLMSNLYVQMQDTWHNKDISSLRPYMTDAFYSQMDRQLDAFRRNNRTDFTENIAVLNVGLKGWRQSAGMDYITVSLTARIVSYVLDDVTGRVVAGDKNREKFMEYEIELCRKSGTITSPETEGIKSSTCPHCGAPLKLNASARCEYCGSVITNVNTDWAVCGMKGISQRTV